MLYAKQTKNTEETFEARCPHCSLWNIFSRASDLGDFRPIAFRKVHCQAEKCGQEFAINGDTIDPRFAKALFAVFELLPQKQYGQSVTNICRAYELFFIHYLRETFGWKVLLANREEYEVAELNEVLQLIERVTRGASFVRMRNMFMHAVLVGQPRKFNDARDTIATLPNKTPPSSTDLLTIYNVPVRKALTRLISSDIAKVRNRVIHKEGYRPSQQQTRVLFDEARDILWTLADELGVRYESV